MANIISEFYYSSLRPHEHNYTHIREYNVLAKSYKESEAWLKEHLDGEAKEKVLELIRISDELSGTTSYECFREGFILGAGFIMEVRDGLDKELKHGGFDET